MLTKQVKTERRRKLDDKTCIRCRKGYRGLVGPGDSHWGTCRTCQTYRENVNPYTREDWGGGLGF